MRTTVVAATTAVAAGLALSVSAAPALAAPAAPAGTAGCTVVSQQAKPLAIGASQTYPASTAGTVTILHKAKRWLKVTAATPATGYTVKLAVPAGPSVKVTFKPATGNKIVLSSAPGNADPTRLHVTVYSCPR